MLGSYSDATELRELAVARLRLLTPGDVRLPFGCQLALVGVDLVGVPRSAPFQRLEDDAAARS